MSQNAGPHLAHSFFPLFDHYLYSFFKYLVTDVSFLQEKLPLYFSFISLNISFINIIKKKKKGAGIFCFVLLIFCF